MKSIFAVRTEANVVNKEYEGGLAMLVLKIAGGIVCAYIGIKGAGLAIRWLKFGLDGLEPPQRPK